MAAPVSGPATRIPRVMVRPMPKPEIALNAPFSSTAVAKTTRTTELYRYLSGKTEAERKKIRAKVPMKSATSCCEMLYMEIPHKMERKMGTLRTGAFYPQCGAESQSLRKT